MSVRTDYEHKEFLKNLANDYGVKKKEKWANNNSTLVQRAYVIDCKNLKGDPADIISRIYKYNMVSGRPPVLCIPVAGWNPEKDATVVKGKREEKELGGLENEKDVIVIKGKQEVGEETFAKKELVKGMAHSFSLSDFTTTGSQPVDFILRASKESQKIKVFEKDGKYFARISAGVRVTDADEELFEKYGLAFFPNNTTLHPASVGGIFSNGCYGPDGVNGPISTKVVEMRVIDPFGSLMTLSEKENSDLFRVMRDCSMGTCFFIRDITIEVQKKYPMKQHHIVYKDVTEMRRAMRVKNPIEQDHFIAMYIPVENGLRVTTLARTDEIPTNVNTQQEKDFSDYLSLILTDASEPLIDLIANSGSLRPYLPAVLKLAALKTYGCEKESTHVDWSAPALHIFGTYTKSPIFDINWLIQVKSRDDARRITADLLTLAEKILKEERKKQHFPILNAFVRYTKGVADPEGKKGIAPTIVDKDTDGIIAFEFVTYMSLSKTDAFKKLVNAVIEYLKTHDRKFTYHYPKHMPDNINSLTQLLTDDLGQKRLSNLQEGIFDFHGGEQNIPFSPLLTPEKKRFVGLSSEDVEIKEAKPKRAKKLDNGQRERVLHKVVEISKEINSDKTAQKATKHLKTLK